MLVKRYANTNFVTGMRAYAALAVVLIHAGGAGLRAFGPFGNAIVNFGGAGVHVFFVISGFSVASSFEASDSYGSYLNRRIWRIAPLYFFWIAIAAGAAALRGTPLSSYNLFMHLTFLSFLDYRVANSILGIEWSISIEVFWYLVIPTLLALCRNVPRAMVASLFALSIYEFIDAHANLLPVPAGATGSALHWSPLPYAVSYCLGIAAYRIRQKYEARHWITTAAPILTVFLLLGYLLRLRLVTGRFYDEMTFASILSFILIAAGTDDNRLFRWLFCNRVAQFVGVMSYGVYLSHTTILGAMVQNVPSLHRLPLVLYVLVVGISVAVSTVAYIIIERPTQRFGQHLWRRRSPSTAAHQQAD